MKTGILSFVAGTLLVSFFSPATDTQMAAGIVCIGLVMISFLWLIGTGHNLKRTRITVPLLIVSGFLSGFVYAWLSGKEILDSRLCESLNGHVWDVTGRITSLPEKTERGWKFRLSPETISGTQGQLEVKKDLLLTWYTDENIKPGEIRNFRVRLTRPRGSYNLRLFDYESWLFMQGIAARGYVLASGQKIDSAGFYQIHHQLRAWIRDRIERHLDKSSVSGQILALAIGESNRLNSHDWTVLSGTGTNHLLVISGLHLGLVFGGIFWILKFSGVSYRNSVVFSMITACVYAALAGFGMPVQRATVMVLVTAIFLLMGRKVNLIDLFFIALFAVIVKNPFSYLSAGFQLSFGAVFLLVYAFNHRYQVQTIDRYGTEEKEILHVKILHRIRFYLRELAGSQWVLSAGMFPMLLFAVRQYAYFSFVANIFALPLTGIIIIPLLLLASLLVLIIEPAGAILLDVVEGILVFLWRQLQFLAEKEGIFYSGNISTSDILTGLIGVLILFAPTAFRTRYLGMVCFLPLIFPNMPEVRDKEIDVSFLDVGQGSAILLRTSGRSILYDAGPRYGDKFDTGSQIVLPVIHLKGRTLLDMMVVSHADNDHSGGAEAVLKKLPVNSVRSGVRGGYENEKPCAGIEAWNWDGVEFVLMGLSSPGRENNSSCLLKITTEKYKLLIPGDIEEPAEREYVRLHRAGKIDLSADILVSPHHGSLTSSSPAFLNLVGPRLILISAGYMNRFSHPAPTVLNRYLNRRISYLNTAYSGGIEFSMGNTGPIVFQRSRFENTRFWRTQDSTDCIHRITSY